MEWTTKYRDVFKGNYLTHGLPQEAIDGVAELGELVHFPLSDVILVRGSRSADLYVILDGKAIVYGAGKEKLGEAGPGSVVGEIALVDAGPRSADVAALTSVDAVRLPADRLRRYMAEHKDQGFTMLANLARVLSVRLRSTSLALEDLAARNEDPWRLAT